MTMHAFEESLSRFRGFDDPLGGVSEEYLPDPVGPNGLAILTRPLGKQTGTGFVICRSPGPEQGPLQRLEAMIARTLGARGFPTIRIRRGFALEGAGSELNLDESIAEAQDAVSALSACVELDRVGTIGELLGSATALVTAAHLELPLVVLVHPVTTGSAYVDGLYRRHLISGVMTPSERIARREPLGQQLARGPVALRGVKLTPDGFEALAATGLEPLASAYDGAALIVGVSRDGEPDEAVRALGSSFRRPTVQVLQDPLRVPFGELHLRKARNRITEDVRIELDRRLAGLTADWAELAA
ncbi:MAG TPA: hypothetical protein VH063_11385 [Gaiellaceae bacterium]|jgi:hypothetical protein|nr:hypothetical protein [Gaiellaceae bacterium]